MLDESAAIAQYTDRPHHTTIRRIAMANAQTAANPPAPSPEAAYPPVPQYSASGRPNTRSERIAFQVWVIMFLLVIVFTLINYLVAWIF
jgi:hypothetical protein